MAGIDEQQVILRVPSPLPGIELNTKGSESESVLKQPVLQGTRQSSNYKLSYCVMSRI